ncbi:hypothetical protein CPS_0836 [Colwellia psychrerythraea 34H]|uniref:Uncharacterized protein n=1 Tax=Colwellia psychrerythraea (strain 34H / ATCC BAA-681) TaxID=167879 RepID=Q488D0_COLP3|nr:hypothetical protein CPS_0836 [Colwellia psychrerythraea 34H]
MINYEKKQNFKTNSDDEHCCYQCLDFLAIDAKTANNG